MKYFAFYISLTLLAFNFEAFASQNEAHYSICRNVSTVVIGDPYANRSLILNYNPSNDQITALRCGLSDSQRLSTNKISSTECRLIRSGSVEQLCLREKRNSRVARVIGEVLDTGISSIISGGMSNFSKFQKAINIARTIRVNPTCLGIELIKSLAQNLDNRADIFNLYYNYQTELAPLTGLNRFLRRNSPRLRAQAVFGSLDSLMIGGHGSSRDQENQSVLLRGPAYFQLERSKSMLNLSVYEDNLNSFCSHLGSTPQATSQIRRTTQRAARSVN